VSASQRKIFRIKVYEPQTCNAKIESVTGTMMSGAGTGSSTWIAAVTPPMSAPASIVLPMSTPISAG